MNKVKIIADSTCDISLDFLKKNDIDILPLRVLIHGEEHLDLEEIKWKELEEKINKYNELPKTSAINIGTYIETFEKYSKEGYDIIFISIGDKFSSNYKNAVLAKEEFENVYVINSDNLSSAIGLMIMKMIKYRNLGLSAKEIYEKIEELKPRVITETALKTMNYLYKGGRCSGGKYLVGTLLKLYPIVRINGDGEIKVHKIGKLRFKNALDLVAADFKKELENGNVDEDFIIISNVGNPESQEYLYNKVSSFFPKDKIFQFEAGCVVGAHCGPGTTGFFYIRKNRIED